MSFWATVWPIPAGCLLVMLFFVWLDSREGDKMPRSEPERQVAKRRQMSRSVDVVPHVNSPGLPAPPPPLFPIAGPDACPACRGRGTGDPTPDFFGDDPATMRVCTMSFCQLCGGSGRGLTLDD
jgi:hypothetical protein